MPESWWSAIAVLGLLALPLLAGAAHATAVSCSQTLSSRIFSSAAVAAATVAALHRWAPPVAGLRGGCERHLAAMGFGGATAFSVYLGPISAGQRPRRLTKEAAIKEALMAPLTEELIYTVCGATCFPKALPWPACELLQAPLFLLAHVATALSREGGTVSRGRLASAALEHAHTGLFSVAAVRLLAASGSFLAPLAAHSVCNGMGSPDFARARRGSIASRWLLWVGLSLSWLALLLPSDWGGPSPAGTNLERATLQVALP